MFDELLPWRGKGAQIQIQEEIEIASKPGIVLRVRPSLKVIGCCHDQIIDGGGVGLVQQRIFAKQLGAVADIFIIWTRSAIVILCPVHYIMPKSRHGNDICPGGKIRKPAQLFE